MGGFTAAEMAIQFPERVERLVLEAAADQLGIQVSDEEVDQAFRDRFEEPDKIIEQAREAGAYDTERESMRLARALDRIAGEVERIAPEQAQRSWCR